MNYERDLKHEKVMQGEDRLPLGINGASSYPESKLSLSPDARLTLITDGVVEARDPSGELFGFDRTAALTAQPGEAIAQAAQAFGQEDDIVLMLQFTPAGHKLGLCLLCLAFGFPAALRNST